MRKTKLIASFVVLALIFNIVMPIMTVLATNYNYTITFTATGTHTLENEEGRLKIDGQYVELRDSENREMGEVEVSGSTASISVFNGEAGKLAYNSANQFTLYNTNGHVKHQIDTEINSSMVFMVEDYSDQEPGQDQNDEYEDINIQFTFIGTTGVVRINDSGAGEETDSWSGVVPKVGYTDDTKTNRIYVTNSFGSPKFSTITINGVDYNFDDNEDEHMIEVAGADTYIITATADNNIAVDRTIIWGNPGATDIDDEDDVLENGSARIIAVYDEDGNLIDSENYTGPGHEYGLDEGNNGWANIRPGSRVVFEFIPEYGYQLTKVLSNGNALEAQDTVNQYEFIMPDTNVHFDAEFTRTEDIVKSNSDKVSGGSITLGSNLEAGSVQLSVSNIELSSDKIKGFENAAEGYTVSNYLDIDLYNVFYKGKDDEDDVWSNKIAELDEEATISLQLAEGINADNIVIVHNVHDGEEYEIIEIESYDKETNTITFKTKSFSNYAIATKTTETTEITEKTDKSNNPITGDNIIMIITIFAIATVGTISTFLIAKKSKSRKV